MSDPSVVAGLVVLLGGKVLSMVKRVLCLELRGMQDVKHVLR